MVMMLCVSVSVSPEHNKSIAANSSIACSFAKAHEVACSHLLEGFGMLRVHESTNTNSLRFDLDKDGWPGKSVPSSLLCLRNSNLHAQAFQERIQLELDLRPSEEFSAVSLRCNRTSPFRDVAAKSTVKAMDRSDTPFCSSTGNMKLLLSRNPGQHLLPLHMMGRVPPPRPLCKCIPQSFHNR